MDPLRNRVSWSMRTGPGGKGPALDGAARELLKATYLRPLRDAEAELRSGRGSRLSQILASYPAMKDQDKDDFDAKNDSASTLVKILSRAEHHIGQNTAVAAAREEINTAYLQEFAIGGDVLRGKIGVAGDAADILARCAEVEPRFADARVLEHRIGARPARPAVRVETERQQDGTVVVHTYAMEVPASRSPGDAPKKPQAPLPRRTRETGGEQPVRCARPCRRARAAGRD